MTPMIHCARYGKYVWNAYPRQILGRDELISFLKGFDDVVNEKGAMQ